MGGDVLDFRLQNGWKNKAGRIQQRFSQGPLDKTLGNVVNKKW